MKVTAEVYKNIKKGKAPVNLSKRTIRNVEKSKNYLEYRNKYVIAKHKNDDSKLNAAVIAGLVDASIANYYLVFKKKYEDLYKLLIIILTVNVVCFAVLIGMIAW